LRIYHIKNGDAAIANLRFKEYNKYDGRTENSNASETFDEEIITFNI